jgi:hypothetical protein
VTDGPTRVSPELRLLMALARARPSDAVLAAAERIIAGGVDWDRLCALGVRNRVSGLLHHALQAHFQGAVPRAAATDFKRAADAARLFGMALLSTQISLLERVLFPLEVRHAALKGATLSARWYGDPLIRQVSDIDVLVDADRIVEVVERMVGEGWRIASPFWKGQRLDMFVRYVGVVELDAPDGRRIEVHRLIDGTGLVFDSAALLKRATSIDVAGRPMPVLCIADEFLTAMFHHARHRWRCYHWVADLVSMLGSGVLAQAEIEAARRHPMLGPTVRAALDLARDIDAIVLDGTVRDAAPSSHFLSACLASVDRTAPPPQPEEPPDPTTMEPDFPECWQRTARYRALFQLSRLRPNLTDLDWWPLPPRLAWLHWLSKPLRALSGSLRWPDSLR